ncbi:MAG: hypothetical protein AAB706_01990, partial [Patescibacteria group bacterium]
KCITRTKVCSKRREKTMNLTEKDVEQYRLLAKKRDKERRRRIRKNLKDISELFQRNPFPSTSREKVKSFVPY